ncbi:hypothetical protein ES703_98291 [subsurface metagenome]
MGAGPWAAKLHDDPGLSLAEAAGDVVGLDLLGASAAYAGPCVDHGGVAEVGSEAPGVLQLGGLQGSRGADVHYRHVLESEGGEDPAHGPHEGRGVPLVS